MELLKHPSDARLIIGALNQKYAHTESGEEIEGKVRKAIDLFSAERLLLHPDCGFATFADNRSAVPPPLRRSSAPLQKPTRWR